MSADVVVRVTNVFRDKRIGRNRELGEQIRLDRATAERWMRQGLVIMVEASPAPAPRKGPAPENKADGLDLDNKYVSETPPLVESLSQAGPAPRPAPDMGGYESELRALTNAELVTLAESKGIRFDKSRNKDYLVGKLMEYRTKTLTQEAHEAAEDEAAEHLGLDRP